MQQLQESRRKYDHQIDHLVRELANEHRLPLELPSLKRKNSYHNYRILSHRPHPHQPSQWARQPPEEAGRDGRTRTEPQEIELSKERDRVYSIVKHYREGGLKQMELHLDMGRLKQWHEHNRHLAMQREAESYKARRQPFHQL